MSTVVLEAFKDSTRSIRKVTCNVNISRTFVHLVMGRTKKQHLFALYVSLTFVTTKF